MSDQQIKKIRYYKGQVLTEKDFKDQQKYHIEKLRQHLQRFPFGIIEGLEVENYEGDKPIRITKGMALDHRYNVLLIPEEGLLVDTMDHDDAHQYLSISYKEEDDQKEQAVVNGVLKSSRIIETVVHSWDEYPNKIDDTDDKITLAKVTLASEQNSNGKYEFTTTGFGEGRLIRRDAKLIPEESIKFRDVGGHDHSGDKKGQQITSNGIALWELNSDTTGIKTEHIRNQAITYEKIDPNAIRKIEISAIADDAITSPKIAEADGGTSSQDTSWGNGIKESHIQNGAIVEGKIANGAVVADKIGLKAVVRGKIDAGAITSRNILTAKAEVLPELSPEECGINTDHIQDGAVTSIKILGADGNIIQSSGSPPEAEHGIKSGHIRIADGSDVTNPAIGDGIKTAHISNEAITSRNLAVATVGTNGREGDDKECGIKSKHIKVADQTSDVNDPNDGDGIKTAHINNGAITSLKILGANGEIVDCTTSPPEAECGIKTDHIQNGAITSIKISGADGNIIDSSASSSEVEYGIKSGHIRIADNSNVNDSTKGDGIKTAHIHDGAITSIKILGADGEIIQSNTSPPETEWGIKSAHIQENAILSKHIAEAKISTSPEQEGGVKATHIQGNAILSRHIKFATDNQSPPDPENESGIKTEHIQDGAVTFEKLSEQVQGMLSPITSPPDALMSPTPGVFGQIQSFDIGDADGGESIQDITIGTGIKTAHLQDEAVTSTKLSLIEIEENGTIGGGDTIEVNFDFKGTDYDKARMGQVIPVRNARGKVGGELSWQQRTILLAANKIRYKFIITNHSNFAVEYKRRILRLN